MTAAQSRARQKNATPRPTPTRAPSPSAARRSSPRHGREAEAPTEATTAPAPNRRQDPHPGHALDQGYIRPPSHSLTTKLAQDLPPAPVRAPALPPPLVEPRATLHLPLEIATAPKRKLSPSAPTFTLTWSCAAIQSPYLKCAYPPTAAGLLPRPLMAPPCSGMPRQAHI